MRNMTVVMEKFGVWARTYESIGYSHIAAGFKGLLPQTPPKVSPCNDDDGLSINSAMSLLLRDRPNEYICMVLYYIWCVDIESIAKKKSCSPKTIQRLLRIGEGYIDGSLSALDIKLSFE